MPRLFNDETRAHLEYWTPWLLVAELTDTDTDSDPEEDPIETEPSRPFTPDIVDFKTQNKPLVPKSVDS